LLVEAKLRFIYATKREAEAVNDAISPDNIKAPSGLQVKTTRHINSLVTYVRCEKSIGTLIATLDDLVACISVAEQAFMTTQVKNKVSKTK
jgi:hypothetical protein